MMGRAARGLVFALALVGCEKEPPSAASPEPATEPAPPVVVEQPGTTPVTEPPDDGAKPGEEATRIVPTDVPCQTDADCVKDACCHATSCVAVADAPDCSQVACTMDCRAETMDCFGGCLCQAGRCAAQLWSPSDAG